MNRTVTLRYRLQREAGEPVIVGSTAYSVPLATPADYAQLHACEPACPHPVLVDHAQYFVLLADIVQALWDALGTTTRVFIGVRTPSTLPLPALLLDPHVVMGRGLEAELAFWHAHGLAPALGLRDRIRRDLDHAGDNTLQVGLSSPCWRESVDEVLVRAWPRHALRLHPAHDGPDAAPPPRSPARTALDPTGAFDA